MPLHFQSTTWGPPTASPELLKFKDAPFAPFSKGDKLGKAADWASEATSKEGRDGLKRPGTSRVGNARDPFHAYGASASSFFVGDESDSSWQFNIVDSNTKLAGAASNKSKGPSSAVLKARGAGGATASSQRGGPPAQQPGRRTGGQGYATGQGGQSSANQQRGGPVPHYRRYASWSNQPTKNRESSIAVEPSWKLIQANTFSEFQKLSYDLPESEVLERHGEAPVYDNQFDKLARPVRLRPVDSTVYNVTTSEDPVIQRLAKAGKAKIFATDAVLSLLMCATKPTNPWDIVVNKRDGQIFFDKRDGGPLDFLSVDENSHNPPEDQATNPIDSAPALAVEATYINQNFAANVAERQHVTFEEPNPFSDGREPENEPLLPKGYIYKSFNLETDPEKPPTPLIVRLEVDAVLARTEPPALLSVKSLNEYGGTRSLEWKDRFLTQRGAIVTSQMKSNLAKLSQWNVSALLADIKSMKVGFVSRMNARDKTRHEIVGVVSFDPKQLAQQIQLNLSNGWGIIKSLYNIFSSLDDGHYVVMRDPNAPSVKIYSAPKGASA